MPVFICTLVLRVYGCVLSHTKTLVQILRPEGLSVIHKTLVIGNPKTSIPGKCDPRIRHQERYQGDRLKEGKEDRFKKKKKASKNKAAASKNKSAASKKLIEQNARKQETIGRVKIKKKATKNKAAATKNKRAASKKLIEQNARKQG